jgi:integrase/recombinase XerD
VARLFDAVANLRYRLILQTAYAAGLRVSEVVRLQVGDIDAQRMVLHIRDAKGHVAIHGSSAVLAAEL